jgi:hypothetical protein
MATTTANNKEYQIGPRTPGWKTRMIRHYHEQHPKLRAAALHRVIRQLHGKDAPPLPIVARYLMRAGVDAAKAKAKAQAKPKTRRKSTSSRGYNSFPRTQVALALERPSGTEPAPKQPQIKRSRLSHDKVREKAATEHHRALLKLKRLSVELGGLPRMKKLLAELAELSA